MEERIKKAVDAAMLAFWDNLAEAFPEVKTGDFPPDAHFVFDEACLKAATIWVEGNWPENVVIELQSTQVDALSSIHSAAKLIRVTAEAHSDDHVHSAEFNAAPWFAQASVEEIVELHGIEWKGDYAADAVAHFFEGKNQDVSDLFKYIGKTQGTSRACGFECSVDGDEAMAWLKEHRRGAWALLLCHNKNVRLFDHKETELKGWWEWVDENGIESDSSFRTVEDAALDAVEELGLAA